MSSEAGGQEVAVVEDAPVATTGNESEAGPSSAVSQPGARTNGIVPIIQNVVATVQMNCKLDLRSIVRQARNAEYNPRRFAAVIMRIREPKTTALMFASGKQLFPFNPFMFFVSSSVSSFVFFFFFFFFVS